MHYNGRKYIGVIDNGQWLVEGIRFPSPSGAAGGLAEIKFGNRTNLDGWRYWSIKRPGDTIWTPILKLRNPSHYLDHVAQANERMSMFK